MPPRVNRNAARQARLHQNQQHNSNSGPQSPVASLSTPPPTTTPSASASPAPTSSTLPLQGQDDPNRIDYLGLVARTPSPLIELDLEVPPLPRPPIHANEVEVFVVDEEIRPQSQLQLSPPPGRFEPALEQIHEPLPIRSLHTTAPRPSQRQPMRSHPVPGQSPQSPYGYISPLPQSSLLGTADDQPILGARFHRVLGYLLLILTSLSSVQIIDCSNLGDVGSTEAGRLFIHVNSLVGLADPQPDEVGRWNVVDVCVISSTDQDGIVLGVLLTSDSDSTLVAYSPSNGNILSRISIPGASPGGRVLTSGGTIALSTTNPACIRVFSVTPRGHLNLDIQSLWSVSASELGLSYAGYPTAPSSPQTQWQELPPASEGQLFDVEERRPTTFPTPMFSLSGRLLAYASRPTPNLGHETDPNARVYLQPVTASSSSSTNTKPGPPTTSYPASADSATSPIRGAFSSLLSGSRLPTSESLGLSSGGLGPSNTDRVASAAIKVGGSMLSGVRTLVSRVSEGMNTPPSPSHSHAGTGYSSSSHSPPQTGTPSHVSVSPPNTRHGRRPSSGSSRITSGIGAAGALSSRFFSKSAPTAASVSQVSVGAHHPRNHAFVEEDVVKVGTRKENAYWVSVVDLKPLLEANPRDVIPRSPISRTSKRRSMGNPIRRPRIVTEFVVAHTSSQSVQSIEFSKDGMTLAVSGRDGQLVNVFQIKSRPYPTLLSQAAATSPPGSPKPSSSKQTPGVQAAHNSLPPWHLYSLSRGRTTAVIEAVEWAGDARWVGIATRNRTVHVFATNPYGGKTDVRSHVEGKVRDSQSQPTLSTDLSPLVRLRFARSASTSEHVTPPLAFTFLDHTTTLPSSLRPPTHTSPYLHPSASPDRLMEPSSPGSHQSPKVNYQDILVFDPLERMLSLRRISLDAGQADSGVSLGLGGMGLSLPSSLTGGLYGLSTSLPVGMFGSGSNGRISASSSPSSGGFHGHAQMSARARRTSAGVSTGDKQGDGLDLTAREAVIGNWDFRRRTIGDEDLGSEPRWFSGRREGSEPGHEATNDWLAQAELSTFSKIANVLPRPIYLSHQFTFRSLGEDYHALLRRYQFDIGGPKINVRREVEISPYSSAGMSESFIEGFSAPRDTHQRVSSSFDEPLASALSAGMDYTLPPPVIPMLPNGAYGSNKLLNSLPIRTTMAGFGDGMTESLGKFKREMTKARSPPHLPRSDTSLSAPVPLEFDEEDEDFLVRDVQIQPDASVIVQSEQAPRASSDHRDHLRGEPDNPSTVPPETMELDDPSDPWWQGWAKEDHQAVEEAEQFDAISVVGFLNEEKREEEDKVAIAAQVEGEKKKKMRGKKKK